MRRWAKTYMTYSSYHTGFRTTKGTFHFRTSHVHWCHCRYPEERQEHDGWRHHLHFTETLKKLHGEGKCVILQSVLQYPLSLINLESVSIYTYIISNILFHTFQIYCIWCNYSTICWGESLGNANLHWLYLRSLQHGINNGQTAAGGSFMDTNRRGND